MAKAEEELAFQEAWVRDCLAVERSILANERTLLAYIRTALGFFIGGVSFIEFFESIYMQVVGWIFIPAGLVVFGLAFLRFKKIRALIKGAERACLLVPRTTEPPGS